METIDSFKKLYKEEKRRSEALTALLDILTKPDFPQLIKLLPQRIADIFQATASIFLIHPEKEWQNALVLQGTNTEMLKNKIGWIHYLPDGGINGWVGKTAQRLLNGVAITELPRYPELKSPCHFLPTPLVAHDGKPFGLLWLARPGEEPPFAYEDEKLLQEISGKVAEVIEHENLHGKIQNVSILEALQAVRMRIHPDITPDEILQLILEQAAKLSDATNGTIGVVNSKTGLLEVRAACGSLEGVEILPLKDKGITRHVVDTGKLYCCPDVTNDPYYYKSDSKTLSELCVPIKVGGETIGDINIESQKQAHFSLEHEHLLTLFAVYAGAAVVMTQPRLTDKLRTLLHIGQELLLISEIEDPDDILGRVVSIAAETLQCERVNIWLKDTTGKRVVLNAACGGREQFLGKQFYNLDFIDESGMKGEGLSGKVAAGSIPKIRTRAAREEKGWKGKYNKPEEGHAEPPGSVPMMILPLRTPNDNIIGVIRFSRSHPRKDRPNGIFNESDERFAFVLAQQIAAVLSAYLSFDKLQTLIDLGREIMLISSPVNLDEMLTKVVSLAVETIQCERVSIWLKDVTGKRVVLRAASGKSADFIGKLFYDLDVIDESGLKGEGLTGKVATGSREKIQVRATREVKGWKGKYSIPEYGHAEPRGSTPAMILPLRTTNEIVGVIRFERPYYRADRPDGCFNDSDERFALAVAQLIAIAVEIARLFEEVIQRDKKKMVAIEELARGTAHEIFTPLAVIKGQVDLLVDELSGGESSLEHLEMIKKYVSQSERIVRGLQTFGRLASPKFKSVDLNAELDEAVAVLQPDISQQNIRIIKKYASSVPNIKADASQLNQLFLNIFKNSREAMPNGGRIEIKTALIDNGASVEIQIRDTGIGMSSEVQKKAIEPFFTTKEASSGRGLGLSICYGIVQQHEGTLNLQSEEGQGTMVIITLPTKRRGGM